MKILIYNDQIQFGGAERVLSILANSLVKNGHQVRFFLGFKHTPCYEIDPYVDLVFRNSIASFRNPISIYKESRCLRQEVLNFFPDVIVTFFGENAFIAHLGIHKTYKPILVYSQRSDPSISRGKKRILNWFAAKWADGVVLQSQAVQSFYTQSILNKSTVIINPLSIEKLPEYDYNVADTTIISVGRLICGKNFLLLIDSFSKIVSRHPEYKLIIYGEGPERNTLQNKINSLGLQNKVYLPGTTSDIWGCMSKAKLFVLPSNYEGVPNVLIEAMCLGMPCISTDYTPLGAVNELITQGENGIIVPRSDSEALAAAMLDILNDDAKAIRMGENARRMTQRVNVENVTKQWENFFTHLLKIKNKR